MKILEEKSTMKYQILILLMVLIMGCKQNTEPIETEESSVINSLFWINDVDDYFFKETKVKKDFNSTDQVFIDNPLDIKINNDSLRLTRTSIILTEPSKNSGVILRLKFTSKILKRFVQNNGIVNYQIESNQFPYDWSLDSNTYDLIYKKGTFKGTMEFEKVDFFSKDCYQLRIKGSLTKLNNERIDSIKFTYSTCKLYD